MKSRYALLRLIAMLPIVTGLLAAFGFTSKAAEIRIQDKLPSAYTPTDPPAETAKNRLPGKRRLRPTAGSRWGSHRFQDGSRHRPALSYTSQWYL